MQTLTFCSFIRGLKTISIPKNSITLVQMASPPQKRIFLTVNNVKSQGTQDLQYIDSTLSRNVETTKTMRVALAMTVLSQFISIPGLCLQRQYSPMHCQQNSCLHFAHTMCLQPPFLWIMTPHCGHGSVSRSFLRLFTDLSHASLADALIFCSVITAAYLCKGSLQRAPHFSHSNSEEHSTLCDFGLIGKYPEYVQSLFGQFLMSSQLIRQCFNWRVVNSLT